MGGLLTLGFLQLLARMQHSQMLEVYAMRETSVIQHGRTTAAACSIPAACSAAFKASGYSGTFGTSHMAPCCTAWPAGVGHAWRERRRACVLVPAGATKRLALRMLQASGAGGAGDGASPADLRDRVLGATSRHAARGGRASVVRDLGMATYNRYEE